MTEPAPPPWRHPTLRALAQVLGTTTRSLELWREHGAPLGEPYDELAVRLWHLGHALTGKGKVKALADPDPALAPYLDAARAALAIATTAAGATLDDPDRRLKDRQAYKLDLQNARAEGALVRDAQAVFGRLLGQLQGDLRQACSGKLLSDIWQACAKKQRLPAERALRRLLTDQLESLVDDALIAAAKEPAK